MNNTLSGSKGKIPQKKTGGYHAYSGSSKLLMIPLIVVIGFIPFIVRYHNYNTGLSIFNWFSSVDTNIDFFLYFKQILLLITCSTMLIIALYRAYKNKDKIKAIPIFIPLVVYALLAILSTVFSDYASFSLTGIFEQFESIFVLVGYCIVAYYAFLSIDKEEDVEYILKYFLYCATALGILGIFQATGHDFFASDIGLRTILPRSLWNQLDSFQFKFGKYCSYLTLYNPNYVGVYTAMVAPIPACLMITVKEGKRKLLCAAALIGLLVSLYGSKSTAGLISIAVSIIIILIFMRRYILKASKIRVSLLMSGFGVIILATALNSGKIMNRLTPLLKPQEPVTALTDINTSDKITITYQDYILNLTFTDNGQGGLLFHIMDGMNREIAQTYIAETNTITFDDERYSNITISTGMLQNIPCADIRIDGKDWRFIYNLEDRNYYYINRFGRPDKIITAESVFFTGQEAFASGRGYLWSRTIPLLKEYMILGSGADTFPIVFPQQDYVSFSNYGFADEIITKPHSMYLQMGVQTGMLSLIAFLVFYGMYFFSSIRLYGNGYFEDMFSRAGVAIFIGTISFMLTGISNDSCIAVTPVFWGLTGIGIAVNQKVKIMRQQTKYQF